MIRITVDKEHKKFFTLVFFVTTVLLVAGAAYAWTAPTQAPPAGNVPAPVNVGTVAQVKNGALSVNRFMVNEHMMVVGPVAATVRYLNFNSVLGVTGYGFRDNNGQIQFKELGDTLWKPIQSGNRQIRSAAANTWWANPSNGLYYSSVTASCDAGYVAVGGGGYCDASAGGPVALFSSRPAGGTGWEAGCHQSPPTIYPGGSGANAYVVCMQQ